MTLWGFWPNGSIDFLEYPLYHMVLRYAWFCNPLYEWYVYDSCANTWNLFHASRITEWIRKAHLHLACQPASGEGEKLAKGVLRLRALLPHGHHDLQVLCVRCKLEKVPRERIVMLILDRRIAFYYRIFPFRQFRNILWVMAALSLGYGISIDVTIFFQW